MNRPTSRASTATRLPHIPDVELREIVGTGGSGVVYRGQQRAFGREVAVKVVASAGSVEGDERWQRELIAVGRVSNHPNIVPVYAGGVTTTGLPYLVMPYVPGGTLQDRIDRSGAMPADDVATIGAKLAGALATAHAAGVLHRDVKPANVLLSPYGEPQITDFGIARLLDATMTVASSVVATIRFAAPEIVNGERATEATDVYGLGATLHTCLTGAPPFPITEHDTMLSIAARVVNDQPASLRDQGVPDAIARVVDRAMAKDPADRQASARELQEELERVATGAVAAPAAPAREDDDATVAIPVLPPTIVVDAPAQQPSRGPEPTRRLPAAPSAPEPRSAPAPPARRVRADSSRASWIGFAMLAAVLGALAVWLLTDDGGGQFDPLLAPTSQPAAPESSQADPSQGSPTDAPSTTATTDAANSEAAPPPAEDAGATARSYLVALDRGDLDTAWALTSPEFQASQDRRGWQEFWSSFESIEILADPVVSDDGASVTVPLSLDGQREDYVMTLVPGDGGTWLIDGPTG